MSESLWRFGLSFALRSPHSHVSNFKIADALLVRKVLYLTCYGYFFCGTLLVDQTYGPTYTKAVQGLGMGKFKRPNSVQNSLIR